MTDEQKAAVAAADYDTGFAKPPKAGQFDPGQSGNPAGKPKGARSMRTLLVELLDQPVTMSIKGVQHQVSAKQAVLNRLLMQALTGKTQDADLLVRLIKHALPEQFADEPSDHLSADETDILQRMVNKALLAREQTDEEG